MKKYFIILFLFVISGYVFSQNSKVRFYIISNSSCDSTILSNVQSGLVYFQENVAIKLTETYSCVSVMTQYELTSTLNNLRKRALLSNGDDETLSTIGSQLNCDYLISVKATIKGQTAIINAFCLDTKIVKSLCRVVLTVPYSSLDANVYENVSNQLIDGIKKHEICPFKGDINVKIIATKKDTQEEEYSVYCNKLDGYYKRTVTIDNYSENDWTINKVKKEQANGTVQFNLSEELTIEEINPCYECSTTKQGQRIYNEKTTTYADIQKSSRDDGGSGIIVDSARVILHFLDDGTYTVRVKAASNDGLKKTIKEVKAQGICDNSNEPPQKTTNKINTGLYELLGPFPGTAQDKVLSQKDTIKKTDPVSGEEQTITYDFNLTRE